MMAPVTLLKSLRSVPFLTGLPRPLVGIEFTSTSLKMALLKAGPRPEVAGLIVRDIRGLADPEISRLVLGGRKEFACRSAGTALIVPSPIVISKNIEIPSTDSRELREIVNLQAARHTPFSREEIIIDYIPLGTYKQNYTKILLLIVTSAAIKKQLALLEKAGIRPERVLLSQEGIGYFCGRAAKTEPGDVSGFVHIDDCSTDFSVVQNDRIFFIRSIPLGKQQLAEDRVKTGPRFLEEIRRSLETYRAECVDRDLRSVFVAGAVEGLDNLDIALEAELKLPVKVLSYWNSFHRSAVRPLSGGENVSFLDVIAPLAAFPECKVNLLPEEVRIRRSLQQRGMDLFTSGILLLSLLAMLLFISMGRLYLKSEYLKNFEAHYKSLSGNARELEKVFQQNSMIRAYLSGRGYSVKVLSELHDLTPLNMGLNDIRFDREGKFTVRGTSDSMSTVFTFVDLLEKSKYFTDVKTKYTTKRQEGKMDVTDFEINALLNKAAE